MVSGDTIGIRLRYRSLIPMCDTSASASPPLHRPPSIPPPRPSAPSLASLGGVWAVGAGGYYIMGRGLGSLVSSLLFSYAEDMDDAPRDSSDLEKRLEEAIARQQAQLDAFIEETENELAELKSELTSSFEELKELAEKQAEIPDSFEERLSDLEKTKMNAPTERELRRQEEDAEISRIIKIEEENNAERRLVEIEERLERIKDGDDESLKEMDVKLAELEGKLKLLQEYVRSRLK